MECWQDDADKAEEAWYKMSLQERLNVSEQMMKEYLAGKTVQKIIGAGGGHSQWHNLDGQVHSFNNPFADLNECFRVRPLITMDGETVSKIAAEHAGLIPVIELSTAFGMYYVEKIRVLHGKYLVFYAEELVKP